MSSHASNTSSFLVQFANMHSDRSIIINYISEATEGTNVAVAYLYCDYKNERTQSESELLSNIARQLTEQTRSIPSEVREFRSRNAEKKRSAKADEWISLIEVLCLSFQKVFIIVDALVIFAFATIPVFLC